MKTWTPDFIPFGSQYYRYPTPLQQDWDTDLANMKKAGFNTVKFMLLWKSGNRSRDSYDFTDGRTLLDLCQKHGLKAVINPIFGIAPGWFYNAYPDCFMVTAAGRIMRSQATTCYSHTPARQVRQQFLTEMAKALGDHPALLCWDVWNEPELSMLGLVREPRRDDLLCYCDRCRARFVEWLRAKYQTVDTLENAWHAAVTRFEDICLPRMEMAYKPMVDFRNFFADVLAEELALRAAAVRSIDDLHPVMCHTVPHPYFNFVTTASDEYRLQKPCDLFGNSLGSDPFAAAVNTSAAVGKTVINSEIHAIGGTSLERPGLPTFDHFKRHIYTPLSRGIKGFLFWQYRAERIGYEAPCWGMTKQDGSPEYWLDYASQLADAVRRGGEALCKAKPLASRIAILVGNENEVFSWYFSQSVELFDLCLRGAFAAFYELNYNVDVINFDRFVAEKADYDLIYLPLPYYLRADVAEKLKAFTADGGTLVGECFFGGYQDEDGLHSLRVPGYGFDRVFGAVEARVEMEDPVRFADSDVLGCRFREELSPDPDTAVLARFANGSPAVTLHPYGRGQAILVGTLLSCSGSARNLFAQFARLAGLQPNGQTDLRVDALWLLGQPAFLFLTNNAGQQATEPTDRATVSTAAETGSSALPDRLPAAFAGEWFNALTGQKLTVAPDGSFTAPIAPGGCEMYRR